MQAKSSIYYLEITLIEFQLMMVKVWLFTSQRVIKGAFGAKCMAKMSGNG